MIDFGYPQLADTEQVKQFVFTEPIVDLQNINTIKEMFSRTTKSNINTQRSIADSSTKNEIYVDIIEKVTCLFSRNGTIISSGIDGCIKMKSYIADLWKFLDIKFLFILYICKILSHVVYKIF
jgi:AP-4 complex subunit mu-1